MYDDYIELEPGALEQLAELLRTYFSDTLIEPMDSPTDISRPPSTTGGRSSSMKGLRGWMEGLRGRNQGAKLPQHQLSRGSTAQAGLDVCPKTSGASTPDHSYVMLCLPYMSTGKLSQPDVCKIKTDQDFFRSLRDYYKTQRNDVVNSMGLKFLRKVRQINFVQVGTPSPLGTTPPV